MSTTYVTAGETYSGLVSSCDTLIVEPGGSTFQVQDSGTEIVEAGGSSLGDTALTGGTLTAENGSTIGGIGIDGGTVDLTNYTSFVGDGIDLSSGLLEVSTSTPTPDLTYFGPHAALSIAGLSTSDIPTISIEDLVNVVITDGSQTYTFSDYDSSLTNFQVTTANGIVEVVCFLDGTIIATPDGGCAIETLKAGDLVLTADGAAMPVRWLGRQTIAMRFANAHRVAPIRIREGALAPNLPARDLLVSPDHALMVHGVFVQAGALVNGVSILREDADLPETFIYYHVELADHSLILAEGVPAETFIDNVDRLAFDNWEEHSALGDETAPMTEMPYARAKASRQVPRPIRERLVARGCELYGTKVVAVA